MSDDYDIGYGKPPKHTQFQPGRSGNPKGRPKGARCLKSDLRDEITELVPVTIGGRTRRVSKQRLILMSLAAKAAKGNVPAAQRLIDLIIQLLGIEDERSAARPLSDTDQLILNRFLGGDLPPEAPSGGQSDA